MNPGLCPNNNVSNAQLLLEESLQSHSSNHQNDLAYHVTLVTNYSDTLQTQLSKLACLAAYQEVNQVLASLGLQLTLGSVQENLDPKGTSSILAFEIHFQWRGKFHFTHSTQLTPLDEFIYEIFRWTWLDVGLELTTGYYKSSCVFGEAFVYRM